MTADDSKKDGERIAKRLARSGLCSRRDAERLIAEGRVRVNGKTLSSPAFNVSEDDDIVVDNKPIKSKDSTRVWIYHKPDGLVTSHKDEKGRATVFDSLPPKMPRVISVGRLDLNSEGLLLLTNNGELSRYMELPSTGWERTYRVRVLGHVNPEKLKKLEKGITVDGVKYGPIHAAFDARIDEKKSANNWLKMTLTEGKNREIRKVLEAVGLSVNRLIRISYGPFELGEVKKGEAVEVDPRSLKKIFKNFPL